MKLLTYSLLAMTLALTSCSTEELIEPNSPIESTINLDLAQQTDKELADEILYHVNQYRSSLGLEPIIMCDTYASAYAVDHSKYMIQQNRVSHDNFSDRAEGLNSIGAQNVAENVAFGFSSAQDFVNAWINSPSHRDILEGNYIHSGLGALQDSYGDYYVTHLFYRK